MFIHGDSVGVSRAERDPGAITGPQNGLESGDQTAGGNKSLDAFAALYVHVRFPVRHYVKRAERPALHAYAKTLGRPHRFSRFPQARLFFSRSASLGQALGEV